MDDPRSKSHLVIFSVKIVSQLLLRGLSSRGAAPLTGGAVWGVTGVPRKHTTCQQCLMQEQDTREPKVKTVALTDSQT
jgi:hypothetical protein